MASYHVMGEVLDAKLLANMLNVPHHSDSTSCVAPCGSSLALAWALRSLGHCVLPSSEKDKNVIEVTSESFNMTVTYVSHPCIGLVVLLCSLLLASPFGQPWISCLCIGFVELGLPC